MTERTRAPHAHPAEGRRAPEETADEGELLEEPTPSRWSQIPLRLRVALLVSALGAALMITGPVLGLVGDQPPAGFAALPLLIVLALLAPLSALVAVLSGRLLLASGVLIGFALLAPGRALTDLQFARDALLASRPELMVPTSLAPLTASAGLWLLIAGHVAAAVAGALVAGTAGAEPGSAYAEQLDDTAGPRELIARRYLVGAAIAGAAVVTVGLFRPVFRSRNAFLLARELMDNPTLVRLGGLVTIGAVALGLVFATSSARAATTKGVLLGLLAGLAGVFLPGMVAGQTVDRLEPATEPYYALSAVVVLLVVVFLVLGTHTSVGIPRRLLELHWLHRLAGAFGVLTGIAAIIGGLGTQLVVGASLDQPASYANRPVVAAGVLVALLGAALFAGRVAATVRPAFTVALVSVAVAGAGALDAALTGAGALGEALPGASVRPAVNVGYGVWFTGATMIIAVVAAACAGLAGTTERDEVDLTEHGPNRALVIPSAAGVLLAVGAFALPAVRAPGFVAPGIWADFRLTSWGLLLGLLAVVAAAALAPVSRPPRAVALLLGAAGVVGVRLLEFPLTGDRAAASTPGPGTWLALGCFVMLGIAAVVALVSQLKSE
jgi:hypothetical protein